MNYVKKPKFRHWFPVHKTGIPVYGAHCYCISNVHVHMKWIENNLKQNRTPGRHKFGVKDFKWKLERKIVMKLSRCKSFAQLQSNRAKCRGGGLLGQDPVFNWGLEQVRVAYPLEQMWYIQQLTASLETFIRRLSREYLRGDEVFVPSDDDSRMKRACVGVSSWSMGTLWGQQRRDNYNYCNHTSVFRFRFICTNS